MSDECDFRADVCVCVCVCVVWCECVSQLLTDRKLLVFLLFSATEKPEKEGARFTTNNKCPIGNLPQKSKTYCLVYQENEYNKQSSWICGECIHKIVEFLIRIYLLLLFLRRMINILAVSLLRWLFYANFVSLYICVEWIGVCVCVFVFWRPERAIKNEIRTTLYTRAHTIKTNQHNFNFRKMYCIRIDFLTRKQLNHVIESTNRSLLFPFIPVV